MRRKDLSRTHCYLLVLFATAGTVLRILHLDRSLWMDEPATVAIARLPWPKFKHNWGYGEAAYQGAYLVLMRGWLKLGHSEAWIRLPSVAFALCSILLIYVLARKIAGDRVALISAALLAFSSTDVYYSQEARSYSLGILLAIAASWFFLRAVERNREIDWLGWTGVSVFAVYTHLFASLVPVAHACSLIAVPGKKYWTRVVVHGLIIAALTAPGLAVVLRVPANTLNFDWMPRATPKQVLHMLTFFGGNGDKLVISAIFWVVAAKVIWRDRTSGDAGARYWRGVLVLSWAVVPLLITALASIVHPVFVQRYMIFSLPAAIILAAWGATALPKQLGMWLAVWWCASSTVGIFINYHKPHEDWRRASQAVVSASAAGDAVLIYPAYASPGFDYYYELSRHSVPALRVFGPFYNNHQTDHDLADLLSHDHNAVRRVWVLLRDQGAGRRELGDYSPGMASELYSHFGEPQASKYDGVLLLKFGP